MYYYYEAQRVPLWVNIFEGIDTMTTEELILDKVRKEFERSCNMTNDQEENNVWVMALAVIPIAEANELELIVPNATHVVRVVLRTANRQQGSNEYVDGTDIFIILDNVNQTVESVGEELWANGPPIFHGGTVSAALEWVHQLAEPFYIQLKDPSLELDDL